MSTRVALLSDIHGNSPALKAVLEDIRDQGCSQVFMLGDLINGVDPHGCVQILREWKEAGDIELTCLKGNGEAYLLTPDRDALPRQTESWNTDMIHLVDWWENHMTQEDIECVHTFQDFILWKDACWYLYNIGISCCCHIDYNSPRRARYLSTSNPLSDLGYFSLISLNASMASLFLPRLS